MGEYKIGKKNSINWLRCIATLLITNSHLSALYPQRFSSLSFGGLFGNCVFFLVSGYCLSNTTVSFPKWFSKRIVRVYLPYILFLPFLLLAGYLFDPVWYILFPIEPYHFIPTIVTLYPVLYLMDYLCKSNNKKKIYFLLVTITVQLMYFLVLFNKTEGNVTQHYSVIGLISYFICMQFGGILKCFNIKIKPPISAIVCVALFGLYAIQSFMHLEGSMRIFQWEIAIGFSVFIGMFFLSIENILKTNKLIDLIASLTLEIYLVQKIAIDAFSSVAFPTGLVYCLFSIVAVAFALHSLTSLIMRKINKRSEINQKNLS